MESNDPKIDLEELRQRLPILFVRTLAEMAFADAWKLHSHEELMVAKAQAQVACLVPLTGDLRGSLAIAADPVTLTDLAAGYHSLPDEMVDDGTRLEFLAELGALLVRQIADPANSEIHVAPGPPRIPAPGEIDSFCSDGRCLHEGFGCNGNGWMLLLARFDG
ncbi:MAG: hypothetical protein H6686_06180 [Fibrobacteria bacterium]|nr:hypothetical protein [Fibrobacteria bacterium]